MLNPTKANGRVQPAISQTSKNANRNSRVVNVRQVDAAVNNYRQYILCTTVRSGQVKAWIDSIRTARRSLRPFLTGYEFRAGVGEWFAPFVTRDGAVACWCDGRAEPDEPVLDISRAAWGVEYVERLDEARA